MTEQQEIGKYFFTKQTKIKEPLLTYDTARTYFTYAIQDDYEKLYEIFSNQSNNKKLKMFIYFVEINGKKWCQEFLEICNNKLINWNKILMEASRIWTINDFRVKSNKGHIRVLAKVLDHNNIDIDKYYSSACSSTNEYCLKVKTPDDLKQIVEFKFSKYIEITECYPELDLSFYPPDMIESKIANYLMIRKKAKEWHYDEFMDDFQYYVKHREKKPTFNNFSSYYN